LNDVLVVFFFKKLKNQLEFLKKEDTANFPDMDHVLDFFAVARLKSASMLSQVSLVPLWAHSLCLSFPSPLLSFSLAKTNLCDFACELKSEPACSEQRALCSSAVVVQHFLEVGTTFQGRHP
jgi:hypothetical protein